MTRASPQMLRYTFYNTCNNPKRPPSNVYTFAKMANEKGIFLLRIKNKWLLIPKSLPNEKKGWSVYIATNTPSCIHH